MLKRIKIQWAAFKFWRCLKFGHSRRDLVRYGYRRTTEGRAVAESIIEESSHCRRCGEVLMAPQIKVVHVMNSLSMDEAMWEAMDRDGVIWREHA